jgi:SOS-response transcriptional repressor LexA
MHGYQDGDNASNTPNTWDFKRDPAGEQRFAFSKRQPTPQSKDKYRVLGDKDKRGGRSALKADLPAYAVKPTYATMPNLNVRPNRYNSSVRMVAGDGPAPWDWNHQVSYLRMSVVGEVAAGQYDVTVAYHEPGHGVDADFVMVNPDDVHINRDTFALRVRGQSMIDNEIDSGDIILVQAQDWADDGDFVIACLTDSDDTAGMVTLKRFYRHRHSDRVVLQPANQALSPIHIFPRKGDRYSEDLDGVKIQGRVIAIIKTAGL